MAIIKDIDRGRGEIIRIEVSEFKGQHHLNIRIWYTDKDSGEFKPTQKGVTFRVDQYAELKEAILAAEGVLATLPA
ncbi:MAG: transcriptional coactivator p15/PC4 family protein [Leptospiraceae bacterium]|nr:transcriptional coactivator p15/PC4 family protein [Leptospiraceae bacterium]